MECVVETVVICNNFLSICPINMHCESIYRGSYIGLLQMRVPHMSTVMWRCRHDLRCADVLWHGGDFRQNLWLGRGSSTQSDPALALTRPELHRISDFVLQKMCRSIRDNTRKSKVRLGLLERVMLRLGDLHGLRPASPTTRPQWGHFWPWGSLSAELCFRGLRVVDLRRTGLRPRELASSSSVQMCNWPWERLRVLLKPQCRDKGLTSTVS
jgi:hypothetical protein